MGEVRKTALMIVVLSEIGGVFFHCRKGKDRTGIVKAEVEHLLSQLMEASACE
jgi:protein tyrosine/serine phosphatase